MMEKVTGKSWEELVTEFVKKPLQIQIGYAWPNQSDPDGNAGHWTQGSYFHAEEPDTWLRLNPLLYPAQNINISLPDYVRYMQENLKGLKGSSALLSPATYDSLFFGQLDYAMGWNNGSMDNMSYAFHEDCRYCSTAVCR